MLDQTQYRVRCPILWCGRLRRRGERGGADAFRLELALEQPLERGHAPGAELRARPAPELLERLVRGSSRAVDPRCQHRVERVGHVDDARPERDVLTCKPVRVAGAVEAFVMMADGGHGVVQEAE